MLLFYRPLTGKTFPMGTEQYLLQKERQEGLIEGIEIGIEKGIKKGIEKGIEEGMEQGIRKKTEELVFSLFEDDFPIEKIAKYAKLNTDHVIDILRRNGLI
jgi:flagellar biosynthesis/type III secretory pathway protein FliH